MSSLISHPAHLLNTGTQEHLMDIYVNDGHVLVQWHKRGPFVEIGVLTRQNLVWAVEDHEEDGYCWGKGECYAVQSARRILGSLPDSGRQ